jgi:hypothetical protein
MKAAGLERYSGYCGLAAAVCLRGPNEEVLCVVVAVSCIRAGFAQDVIYRCGNEYTNNVSQAKAKGASRSMAVV